MREHEQCEADINQALAEGRDGFAEFLATRCDLMHGHLPPKDSA